MRIGWAGEALDDLDAIRAYFLEDVGNPHAADAVARAILETANSLDVFPLRGERLPDGSREVPVSRFPQYRLVYDVRVAAEDGYDGVVILHVETQRTDPPRRPTRP